MVGQKEFFGWLSITLGLSRAFPPKDRVLPDAFSRGGTGQDRRLNLKRGTDPGSSIGSLNHYRKECKQSKYFTVKLVACYIFNCIQHTAAVAFLQAFSLST